MGDHPSGLRRLIGTLGVLVVLVTPAWSAGTAAQKNAGTITRDAAWILQPSGPEALGILSRLSAPELRQAAQKHRSVPTWVALAGLGLALPLLVARSRLTQMARRPHGGQLWPPTLPRGPPLLQFS